MSTSGFKIVSEYEPTGDQPKAIAELVEGVRAIPPQWRAPQKAPVLNAFPDT